MGLDRTLLSIVIPTRNRYVYLKDCIRSLLELDNSCIEIIIQDNTQNNEEIRSYLGDMDSSCIKYFWDASRKYSQTENSNLALAHATGYYVCFLGDDDGLIPSVIPFLKWAKSNDFESIRTGRPTYCWPDVWASEPGHKYLSLKEYDSRILEISPKSALIESLNVGGTTIGKMPCVYHGFVMRSVLEKVKRLSGSYCPGPSPDIATATVLSLVATNHVETEIPLMLNGFSYNSAGGRGLRGEHKAKLETVEQLPSNIKETWDPRVPEIWLGSTIYAQSIGEALRSSDKSELLNGLNFGALYARTLLQHPDCYKYVLRTAVKSAKIPSMLTEVPKFVKEHFQNKAAYERAAYLAYEDTPLSILEAQSIIEHIASCEIEDLLKK